MTQVETLVFDLEYDAKATGDRAENLENGLLRQCMFEI
jgi:hypothetical protein